MILKKINAFIEKGQVRLDITISKYVPDVSRVSIQKAITDGNVLVDGNVVRKPSYRLQNNVEIELNLLTKNGDTSAKPNKNIRIHLVFEDSDILVIEKASGITVHPGAGHLDDTLVNGLLASYPEIASVGEKDRPGIVHRLDRDTSGLLVFARSESAYKKLVQMVKSKELQRTYITVVYGHVSPREATIEAPVGRDPYNRVRQKIIVSGRNARTRFKLLEKIGSYSLLEVQLDTGRMHQIRVHMQGIGHPVLGDRIYGRTPNEPGLERQFLHASRLRFRHPITFKNLDFCSPLPTSLQNTLAQLRKL